MKVNIKIRIGDLEGESESVIPRKNWEELLPSIVQDVKNAMDDNEICEEDFKDSTGYIDQEGISHDCTPEQAFIATLLMESGMSMGLILLNCKALENLYNSLKADLQQYAPDSDELSMLEEVEDIELAMYGGDDEDERIVFIEDEYPAILLDEIYANLKNVRI